MFVAPEFQFKEIWGREEALFVDVRTPPEWEEDHIPGSINLPVLDIDQRAEIGTIYKQESPKKALYKGGKYICGNIPAILDQLEPYVGKKRIIFYCWRGGLRSKSISLVMKCMNLSVGFVEGGYKKYRRHVIDYLDESHMKAVFVLYGATGTGKTEILKKCAKSDLQTIDLEGLAEHLGSSFGLLPGKTQPSQKFFETLLFTDLAQKDLSKPILFEGESRKIGKIHIPTPVFQQMQEGKKILLDLPLEIRIQNILKDYKEINEDYFYGAMERIKPYMKKSLHQEVKDLFEAKDLSKVVELLLVHYYDPLYKKSQDRYDYHIEATSNKDAFEKVRELMESAI